MKRYVQVQWASDGATDVRDFSKRSSRAKYICPKRNGQDRGPNSELAILRGFPLRLLPRRPHLAHRSPFSANTTTFFRICHSQVRVSRCVVPFLDRARRSGCTLVRIRSKGNLPFLNLNQRQLHEMQRGVRRRTPVGSTWLWMSIVVILSTRTFIAIGHSSSTIMISNLSIASSLKDFVEAIGTLQFVFFFVI